MIHAATRALDVRQLRRSRHERAELSQPLQGDHAGVADAVLKSTRLHQARLLMVRRI
jgi:hypothetical protein